MPARRKSSPARSLFALVLAVGAHALVLWVVQVAGLLDAFEPHPQSVNLAPHATGEAPPEDDRPLEIQSLVDELRSPTEESDAEKRAEEKKKEQEEDRNAKGQVVDIPRPAIEESPDEHARFLAEYDSRVTRETKGRVGHDRAGGESASEESRPQPAPQPPRPERPARSSRAPGLSGAPSPRASGGEGGEIGQGGGSTDITSDGNERRAGVPGLPGARSTPRAGEGGTPGERGAEETPNFQPSEALLTRAIAHGTGSPDYLRDVDDGEATALNAKKFKFASFFNRVKRAVADQWHPDTVYLRHDPSGHVYGGKDRVTVLRVHLEPDGSLKTVTTLEPSGVEFLDDEAIDAFKRAQPFVNPPYQLVDPDGLIHFNFAFIFEISGGTSFKVFKYQ